LDDEAQEHFGLTWPGKREARSLAAMPSKGALIPQPGEGINEDNTHNIFIEGDNLEVLKLLQKSYAGCVKMIYIDPPYNTGNDFVYPDDYSEPLEAYLQRSGQLNETGQKLSTNTRASGRFHSNWLNMMYPRLLLARQLLRNDGVIFVSIDDNEVHNLRQVMGEIYGEENFLATICWERADSPKMDSDYFSVKHDFILCFAKNIDEFEIVRFKYDESNIPDHYNKVDQDGRRYYLKPLRAMGGQDTREDRPNLYYPISAPDGTEVLPKLQGGGDGRWRWGRKKLKQNLSRIDWVNSGSDWTPYFRIYADTSSGKPPETMLFSKDVGSNRNAMADLKAIFDGEKFFDTPKPVKMLNYLIHISTGPNDLIVDFFAGSCTTAQSVIEFNREENSRRQFIMVQLPEPTSIDEFDTIADIGRERIRRVIEKEKSAETGKFDLQPDLDLGFRCFALGKSNYKDWQPFTGRDVQKLEPLFDHFEIPLVEDWQTLNLMIEILLLQGFPLDSRIMPLDAVSSNSVQRVHAEGVGHELFVCLDEKISEETIQQLHLRSEDIYVCLDSALSDEAKIRLADQCNLKVI